MRNMRDIAFLSAFLTAFPFFGCAEKHQRLPSSLEFSAVDSNDSPPARLDASMTTDFGGRRVFLFGGRDASGSFLSDLWVFVDASKNWKRLESDAAPPGRSGASLLWDPEGEKLVMFGGYRANAFGNTSYLRELWIWEEDSGWHREFFEVGPSARAWHGAALANGRIIITGGYGGGGEHPEHLKDAWALDVASLRFERMNGDNVLHRPYRPALLPVTGSKKLVVLGQIDHDEGPRVLESVVDLESGSHLSVHSLATDPADFKIFLADPRTSLLVVLAFSDVLGNSPECEILLTGALAPIFVDQSIDKAPHEFYGLSCYANPAADFSFLCFGGAHGARVSSTTWILERIEGDKP